jgi:UDP-glucuronate 4-epimerase
MRILVTGAAGFIGSHLAAALLSRGDTVVGLDNFNDYYDPKLKRANAAALASQQRFFLEEVDLRDSEALERICRQSPFDAVAHLAAMAGVRYSISRAPLYVDVNIRGTVNLLDAIHDTGVPHVVFASTSSVYGKSTQIPFSEDNPLGRPLAPYPATKISCELMGHAYYNLFGISFTAVRFFSVYGPRGRPDMMPFHIMDCICHNREFALYNGGEMFRDWTYVTDIVAGLVAAIDRPLGYECINLGRGEPVRMADFVEMIESLIGHPARMTTPEAPASEPPITYADISKAQRLLDYHPQTSVQDGLSQQWDWYKHDILATE